MSKHLIHIFFLLLVIAKPYHAFTQTYEVGVTAGTSYYLGDLNPTTHFHEPQPAFGLFARYNVSNHISFRLNLNHGEISGSNEGTPYAVKGASPGAFDFSASITELSIQGEVNFLPFIAGDEDNRYTTYLFAGTGAFAFNSRVALPEKEEINEDSMDRKYRRLSYLIGLGFKFHVTDKLTGGLDWGLRNTTTNQLDSAPGVGNPKIDDWYSFAGLSLTIRIRDRSCAVCPY